MRTNQEIASDLRKLADEIDPPIVTIEVGDAAALSAALLSAPVGSVIKLADTDFVGKFTLDRPMQVTGAGRIISPDSLPALTVSGKDILVNGITVKGNSNDLVVLTPTAANTIFDNVTVEGLGSAKRGIRLDGSGITITRSKIHNIARVGQDSQAIAGWNGPGPYVITDNYLEAASENILFGGANPAVAGTIPSDILIARNTLTKRMEWKGAGVNVKNLIELKSGRRVTIQDNMMEHSWVDGQVGYAMVFTPKVEGPVVEDILVEGNTIKDVACGIQLSRAGFTLQNLTFRRNRFEAGSGRFMLMLGGMDGITLENNTIIQSGTSLIYQYDAPVTNFRFVRNLVRVAGKYGICTNGYCYAQRWQEYFPSGVIEENAFEGFPSPGNLPANNIHIAAGTADPEGYGC